MIKHFILTLAVVVGASIAAKIVFAPGTAPFTHTESADPLLDAICDWETRGLRGQERVEAMGEASEFGICQIRASTMRLLGFDGTNRELIKEAWKPHRSRYWATMMLNKCRVEHRRRGHRSTKLNRAYCFNAGWRSKPGSSKQADQYARQILSDMAHADRIRQWEERMR